MDAVQLCTDAKFTNIAFTKNLVVNNSSVIDNKRNIRCNDIVCNTLYYNTLIDNYEENTRTLPSLNRSVNFFESQDVHLNHITAGNSPNNPMNECDGDYSIILGGQYNECNSDYSVILSGSDNQCHGSHSVIMGNQSIGAHDHVLLWNGSSNSVISTLPSQCMFVSKNGLFFSLPDTRNIRNDHIPEGMACFCWDPVRKEAHIRTHQDGEYYKSPLTTTDNHVHVNMFVNDDSVRLSLDNADGNE